MANFLRNLVREKTWKKILANFFCCHRFMRKVFLDNESNWEAITKNYLRCHFNHSYFSYSEFLLTGYRQEQTSRHPISYTISKVIVVTWVVPNQLKIITWFKSLIILNWTKIFFSIHLKLHVTLLRTHHPII